MWTTETTGTAVRHQTWPGTAAAWAVATGTLGLLANLVLVLFFALARPWSTAPDGGLSWLGPVNDVIIVAQYAAFLPVPLALRKWLPDTRGVRAATVAALLAMLAVVVLQLLLIISMLTFETQVTYVVGAFLVVFVWILAVSRTAYRTAALPRRVAWAGLLIGSGFPLGLAVFGIAMLAPDGTLARYVGFGIGGVIGGAAWLALPVWPLLLAGRVFNTPPGHRPAR
jgi:hypothetical protein